MLSLASAAATSALISDLVFWNTVFVLVGDEVEETLGAKGAAPTILSILRLGAASSAALILSLLDNY